MSRKPFFYFGISLLVLFELANVYFIMPMPFSQRMQSIDAAYFLYRWRWVFRVAFGLMVLAGLQPALRATGWRRAVAPSLLLIAGFLVYAVNFRMSADRMFLAPASLDMRPASENGVDTARLVVGVAVNGEARAYPLHFIGYHHQVRDSVGGAPVLVSYCTVCRTGRVFSPVVDGRIEQFRLVGMDHFNAMFEDRATRSWWRQVNGEAVVGPSKGKVLPEIASSQVTLAQWLATYPNSLVMQPDSALAHHYPKDFKFETGESRGKLTGTDTIPWNDKAWVVGVMLGDESKAYDWIRLRRERVVNDVVGGRPIVVVMAGDSTNFFAFERPDSSVRFVLRGDSISAVPATDAASRVAIATYAITGRGAKGTLRQISASQEFWHSWRTFHPNTTKY